MSKTCRWFMACLGTMLLSVASSNVVAATPAVLGGKLIGAKDVSVGGTLYDVEFLDGTCVELFSGCDEVADFTFQTQAEAETASQALLAEVFLDGVEGDFDADPALTRWCPNTSFRGINACLIITPFFEFESFAGEFGVATSVANNDAREAEDDTYIIFVGTTYDSSRQDDLLWAVWTPQTGVVPELSTLAQLAMGLAALGIAITWSRRHQD